MDESFSDFQEKKKFNSGPKNIQKSKKQIKRKPLKKDIRNFMKSKENDLVSYSKKFDRVCKKSGLDVDAEQLQLAIALSKSHYERNESLSEENTSKECVPLSTQDKITKIKTTLQEYGFKVLNTKINPEINRRKRLKKQYKLVLASDEEKRQIIIDKYSEVLATNVHRSPIKDKGNVDTRLIELYHKATNINFDCIKNNEAFYVEHLKFEMSHDICLLKDWSDIPGRPISPVKEIDIPIKFKDINFSQEELDYILSGSIKATQDIFKSKSKEYTEVLPKIMDEEKIVICVDEAEAQNNNNCVDAEVEAQNISKDLSRPKYNHDVDTFLESNEKISSKLPSNTEETRCVSPDLFDDDMSLVYEKSIKKDISFNTRDNVTFCMDLTECVVTTKIDLHKSKIDASLENNISHRKSNDFMEITNCVSTSTKQPCIEEIDLTQGYIPSKISVNERLSIACDVVKVDLSQSPNSDTEVYVEDSNNDRSVENTIIVDYDEDIHISTQEKLCQSQNATNQDVINTIEDNNIDLSETPEVAISCSKPPESNLLQEVDVNSPTYSYTEHVFEHSYIYDCDKFDDDESSIDLKPISDTSNNNKSSQISDATDGRKEISDHNESDTEMTEIFFNISKVSCGDKEMFYNNSRVSKFKEDCVALCNVNTDLPKSAFNTEKTSVTATSKENDININNKDSIVASEHIDFNMTVKASDESTTNVGEEHNGNLEPLDNYNDYVFEHSYNYAYNEETSPVPDVEDDGGGDDKIDLTQSSDDVSQSSDVKNVKNLNCLGKKDDMSIDYDEIIDLETKFDSIQAICEVQKSENVSRSSKYSEVFELSDKEFNYSLHQSRFSNYDTDGFEDFNGESSKTCVKLNRSLSENDLNVRKSPKTKMSQKNTSHNTTPVKDLSCHVNALATKTPNNEFIIKTRDVTPMADYATMSSPERNEELKKYGLKPFKRKRAIQLLTYLYNQTHPVVEPCDLEDSSPAKKVKYDNTKVHKSPKKSPRKSLKYSKSPLKSSQGPIEVDKENLLYLQTKDVPDIKEIYCEPEDWVFQAREKAKVHSCRVPLHIAFHNYVSCRRYLRESILKYEPVNIDVIHKELVSIGYRYNPKDLLKFMDKKCITVKTVDNNGRNRK